jgi:hypothetical protein
MQQNQAGCRLRMGQHMQVNPQPNITYPDRFRDILLLLDLIQNASEGKIV